MRSLILGGLCVAVLLCPAVRAAAQATDPPTPAELTRKALDQKITVDFNGGSFQDAIDHFRQKTKVNILLDQHVLLNMGIGPDGNPIAVSLKATNLPARTALQKMLSGYSLSYIILGDSVLITSEQFAQQRQMRQTVSVDVNNVSLAKALKQLARETAVNVIIDPKVVKQIDTGVTLKLEDTTLETAVRLLTELADLKAVPVGNVLLITDEKRADKIRKENNDAQRQNPFGPFPLATQPFGGGFAMPPRIGGAGIGGVAPGVIQPAQPAKDTPVAPPKQEKD